MTPQLQQAIRLLQLPVLELQAQVQEALESNVMLEAEEDEQIDLTSLDQPAPVARTRTARRRRPTRSWSKWRIRGRSPPRRPGDGRAQDDDDRPLEFTDDRERDLHQHLIWQLEVSRLDPRAGLDRRGARRRAERRRLPDGKHGRDRTQPERRPARDRAGRRAGARVHPDAGPGGHRRAIRIGMHLPAARAARARRRRAANSRSGSRGTTCRQSRTAALPRCAQALARGRGRACTRRWR